MERPGNFGRYYTLAHLLGLEEQKEELVSQFTGGRTTYLHEMSLEEYRLMCNTLNSQMKSDYKDAGYELLKSNRRKTLIMMRDRLCFDTADWKHTNEFCMSPRICGKPFKELDSDELEALMRKIGAIASKKDKD